MIENSNNIDATIHQRNDAAPIDEPATLHPTQDHDDESTTPYAALLGERIRSIRRQKRIPLREVARRSHDEFKPSVLGAYERGERSMSVQRLSRLAQIYDVPMHVLLPRDAGPADVEGAIAQPLRQLTLDVAKLKALRRDGFEAFWSYISALQIRRQDFAGTVLTVRSSDGHALAAMIRVPIDDLVDRLETLDLLAS